ncbi:hypothetical protein GCM10025331_67090 [Actinoplanes utahensis]|nr:hypothetical protein Aut01nite_53330 [Actinoplanes utahensis]
MAGAGLTVAAGIRLARSRHRRSLHPAGRSLTGTLDVWGCPDPVGSVLLDRAGQHPVTVRLSKGLGTRGSRPDVRGLAVRVPTPGRDLDLLLSTVAGRGRFGRHVPMPRRTFDTTYGSIAAYRTPTGLLHLAAAPDPGTPLGDSLSEIKPHATLLLYAIRGGRSQPFARLTLGTSLSPAADEALTFDPIRNSTEDLHPTGLLHGVRALAYPASQRWRGRTPVPPGRPH